MGYKANSFSCKLLNQSFSEIDLFKLHNCCTLLLKSKLESKSQLSIPEFSGHRCILKPLKNCQNDILNSFDVSKVLG